MRCHCVYADRDTKTSWQWDPSSAKLLEVNGLFFLLTLTGAVSGRLILH